MSDAAARRHVSYRFITIVTSGFWALSLAFVAVMLFGFHKAGQYNFMLLGGAIAALSAFAGAAGAHTFHLKRRAQTGESDASPHRDPTTRLLSRCGLESELIRLGDRPRNDGGKGRWLLVSVEIDAFREINDAHGLETGDTVLRVVADRLAHLIGELGPVARIGGSEFAFATEMSNDDSELSTIMDAVIDEVGKPIAANGKTITVFCTAGLVELPRENLSVVKTLRRTNLARATARSSGLGNWAIYHPEMTRSASYRKWIETELVGSVRRNEFDLVYQPQVNSLTGETIGYEALLRWTHPSKGVIPPSVFVPVAEDCGLINQIGKWVLRRACEDARNLPPDIRIAVNVSPKQLESDFFAPDLAAVIEETGVNANQIEIEITENVLIGDRDMVLKQFRHVRNLGCSIAIDDFGMGYSNLGYLAELPFSKLKLDRSLVARLGTKENGGAVVSTIVNLAHALDVDILAEGVETEEQVVLLRAAGCTLMQGYYFGKPLGLERKVVPFKAATA